MLPPSPFLRTQIYVLDNMLQEVEFYLSPMTDAFDWGLPNTPHIVTIYKQQVFYVRQYATMIWLLF